MPAIDLSADLPVEQIDNPTLEIFDRDVIPGRRPVVIRGALESWPALAKWTPEHLAERAGGREVRVTHSPEGVYNAANYLNMRLGEFLERISMEDGQKDQYYVSGIEIAEALPELAPDVREPRFIDDDRADIRHLFIGRNTITGCHFHPYHQNVLTQLVGSKRVVLFGPADFGNLYPKPLWDEHFNWTRIEDLDDYDRDSYPRVARAQRVEVVLEPGMTLHIPVHWWHFIHGEGFGVSLAFFWPATARQWNFPHPGLRCGIRAISARARKLVG